MNMPAFRLPDTFLKRHDRSFIARPFAQRLLPSTGEPPAWLTPRTAADEYPTEPNWLIAESHLPGLAGLDRPWWQMLASSLAGQLAIWRQRARQRRELAQIDARSLREAGIDPVLADLEAAQPFWRKPMTLRDLPADRSAS